MKKLGSVLLALAVLCSLFTVVLASDYTDVSDSAWYAQGVSVLEEKGLMQGVGNHRFDPEGVFTRAQLATVLYRMAGSPPVTGEDEFSDTEPGLWYSDAVLWASRNRVVNGYGSGRFGPNDPTTQEQLAVMLWRDAGSYVLGSEYAQADGPENDASPWAADAVRWARVDGLLTDAISFEPHETASRGQVADMAHRYLLLKERFASPDAVSGATAKTNEGGRVLVAYFSCTGSTEKIARHIGDALGVTPYRITPETPYTSADLNYGNSASRTSLEQNDPEARPAVSGTVTDMAGYDVIFLGYPIWWGQAPKIMYTFVESYDLSGKTIVPFCTSGSSPIGSSATNLSGSAPDATWLAGTRFSGSASRQSVVDWLNGLGLGF